MNVQELIDYAVSRFGQSRHYVLRFGASTPVVECTEPDGSAVAEFWFKNGVIQQQDFV
jgi:hypothetical protein